MHSGCQHCSFFTGQMEPPAICQLSSEDCAKNKCPMCLPLSTAAEPGTPVLQTCSKAIVNSVFTRFYYPPSVSKSAAPSSQKAGTAITTQQCQPQPLSLPTLLNTNATLQWPGAHTNTPTVTLFILEKRMGTRYSYSLIINKSLRTVGNR